MRTGALAYSGSLELIAGDAKAAERDLRAAYELNDRAGLVSCAPTLAASLAPALHAHLRYGAEEHFTAVTRNTSPAAHYTSAAP